MAERASVVLNSFQSLVHVVQKYLFFTRINQKYASNVGAQYCAELFGKLQAFNKLYRVRSKEYHCFKQFIVCKFYHCFGIQSGLQNVFCSLFTSVNYIVRCIFFKLR